MLISHFRDEGIFVWSLLFEQAKGPTPWFCPSTELGLPLHLLRDFYSFHAATRHPQTLPFIAFITSPSPYDGKMSLLCGQLQLRPQQSVIVAATFSISHAPKKWALDPISCFDPSWFSGSAPARMATLVIDRPPASYEGLMELLLNGYFMLQFFVDWWLIRGSHKL